ncbi:MAG: 1-acyl-sn-glycerol-3-phosphate acyltransferase [Clostridia bacterium]|nr:1-acyl-sn-glycerol-3-phosphate acyltransferase [Clostridia bacterium]
MKIKTAVSSYPEVSAMPRPKHRQPKKPNPFFRTLLKVLSGGELKQVHFTCEKHGMEKISDGEPCLILMNHSSFIDLKIASTLWYPKPFNIVCTSDGFVGKEWLMRNLGCIPTKKFITDLALVRDMMYTVKTLKSSILMYPEASYSFDGTATPLPDSLGMLIRRLNVPVVMIRTHGAFLRDPLYNGLRLRKTDVSADMTCLLTKEEIAAMTPDAINEILREQFSFDNFAEQLERGVKITESTRAEGLNRVLYRCPSCGCEGSMKASGITLQCGCCGKTWELLENGQMQAVTGGTEYPHIPDWYRWERECVRQEILDGTYSLDIPVKIRMMVNTKAVYEVGEGHLHHDKDGFRLTGCGGALDYTHKPLASYSLYSDYFWYELGDMICIGDHNALYYCFPETSQDVVAKTRLAAEEIFKITKSK